ncbi:MAG: hypothetical protein CMG63_04425 [Candidatus Marinimicrobia bacterium]|nr:hypothetical protein [Candidatus Neomarinimicrobiota bacterium]
MKSTLKNKKILFCSHEIGNQMQLMAEALRSEGYNATAATYTSEWYGYKNDLNLNLHLEKNKFKRHFKELVFALFCYSNYDIFHFHFGSSLYGVRIYPHLDLPILKFSGKKLFMHYRGSDIIDKRYYDHIKEGFNYNHKLFNENSIRIPAKRNLAIVKKNCDEIFVSTPNLMDVVEPSVLIPQIIQPNTRISINKNLLNNNQTIKIVHAPTDKIIKGTEVIINSINRLKSEGFDIDLQIIENVSPNQVIHHFRDADIGIDQLYSGWYGKVSIELMNLGIPVFCFIHKNNIRHIGGEIPIINVNKNNLTDKIKHYLNNPNKLSAIGQRGPGFVEKNHSQKSITQKLIKHYSKSFTG